MAAINFNEPASITTFEVGTMFYRYSRIGTSSPKHYFTTELEVTPGMLGKNSMYRDPSKWMLEEYTLTKRVTGLESTTNLAGESGATQVFSTQIQGSSTVKTGTWSDFTPR